MIFIQWKIGTILLLGLALSLVAGIVVVYIKLFLSLYKLTKQPQITYREKISKLNKTLAKSSKEVDSVIKEMALISKERAESVTELEKQLGELSIREQEAKARIEALENVPVEAVQYFEKIIEKGDKRSAWRNYAIFGLGVITNTIIAIVLTSIGF